MTPNVAMNVDDANLDFSSGSSFATNNRPANNEFHMNNNANNLAPVTTVQPQPLTASAISLPNFAATIVPINPLQNATQPVFVQQIATPQPVMNLVQPIPVPAVPIPLRADAMQQNLFLQQQQQAQLQLQQQQQAQLQLQQLHHFQQQQQVFPVASVPQQIPTAPQPIIHNLIPEHLQQASHSTTMLNGTTGCAPALILPSNEYVNAVNMMLLAATSPTTVPGLVPTAPQPIQQQQQQNLIVPIPLTVQDRPSNIPPVFNGINPAYPGIETLGVDPPLFLVRDFLSHAECDFLIRAADGVWQPAPVVGKGAGEISPSRTSSTCFLAREDLPDYMKKVSALTSKPIDHCELPQVGRYLPSQQYRHVRIEFFALNWSGLNFDSIQLTHKESISPVFFNYINIFGLVFHIF